MLRHVFFCTLVLSLVAPAAAAAQSGPATKWEIEGLAGFSLGRVDWGGSTDVPPAGPPIVTSSPVFPSWSVPSWMFGDGAAMLNKVAAEFGAMNRIVPLDPLFEPRGVSGGQFQIGVRVRRALAAPYALEVGMDFSAKPITVSGDLRSAIDATSASFAATFGEILGTGPFPSPIVTSGVATGTGSAREFVLTGALSADTRPFGKFVPYGIAGGGLLQQSGELASATVTGNYSFQIAGSVPINETDNATIGYRGKTSFVMVFGGGVRRDLSPRWGMRIDARVLIGPSSTSVEITGSPSQTMASPAGFIETFTYPSLVFSNNASTGRVSTLSHRDVTDYDVFTGGWQMRPRVSVGVFWRF